MSKKQVEANLLLMLTAMIWGFAFVAQRVGSETMGPFAFNGIRFAIGALTLLPVIYFIEKSEARNRIAAEDGCSQAVSAEDAKIAHKALMLRKYPVKAGIICGLILFSGASLQQFGIFFTTAGKTGFITALYIVLVPVFGIFLKHKVTLNAWIGVALATVGLYLLCITESITISLGDFVILIGAGFWAAHILVINHYAGKVSALRLSCMQFAIVSAVSLIVALFVEEISLASIQLTLVPILYSGILSSGVAFTLQIVGQKNAPPTLASIILSMEAVFGALGGWLLLGEMLSSRELTGCAIMFAAIVISQLPGGSPGFWKSRRVLSTQEKEGVHFENRG